MTYDPRPADQRPRCTDRTPVPGEWLNLRCACVATHGDLCEYHHLNNHEGE